jgi:superfamily I DNA/RNA helicase
MKGGHRVLEASAGTGKTTAIIDQALSLLLDEGVPVDQLLIVTFTEKAASELRRQILDILRDGHSQETERLLSAMDTIYGLLIGLDFHDTITGGLRRRVDALRAVLERTRGDVTSSLRQQALQAALADFERRLGLQGALPDTAPPLLDDEDADVV